MRTYYLVENIRFTTNLAENMYAYLLLGGKHPFYHRLGGKPGFVHLSYLIHPQKASTFVLFGRG
jgi:hypothetical protein